MNTSNELSMNTSCTRQNTRNSPDLKKLKKKVKVGYNIRDHIEKHIDILTNKELHFLHRYENKTREPHIPLFMKVQKPTLSS